MWYMAVSHNTFPAKNLGLLLCALYENLSCASKLQHRFDMTCTVLQIRVFFLIKACSGNK